MESQPGPNLFSRPSLLGESETPLTLRPYQVEPSKPSGVICLKGERIRWSCTRLGWARPRCQRRGPAAIRSSGSGPHP